MDVEKNLKNKDGREREVIEFLGRPGGVVEENLKFLKKVEERKWWSHKYSSFMEKRDYHKELEDLRTHAGKLSDELIIALVGNTITEEALPSYTARLDYLSPDRIGVSANPWNLWFRGWSAEEDQHRRVLNHYLLLSGRVNMKAVDRSTFNLIKNGFRQNPSLYQAVFYPTFQEPETRISHRRTSKLAEEQGDLNLADRCLKISHDENRHAQFYLGGSIGIFDLDPEGAMISFYELMKEGVIMPGHLMADETYPKPPTLFDHYADVVQSIGIYTAFDHANILKDLNKKLKIAHRSVSGEAAHAQKVLMRLPSVIRRAGEREKERLKDRKPVPFSWIYDRAV